ncbi:MAG: hypothetical protein ACLT0Y_02695 [Christensenellales bacterium]
MRQALHVLHYPKGTGPIRSRSLAALQAETQRRPSWGTGKLC